VPGSAPTVGSLRTGTFAAGGIPHALRGHATTFVDVDLLRTYSNVPEVGVDVAQSLAALAGALERGGSGRRSVSSTGRSERAWKLEDTVAPDVVARIQAEYVPRVVTHKDLAARYGISQKSVQRLLRKYGGQLGDNQQ
jgi:hypothetical protein